MGVTNAIIKINIKTGQNQDEYEKNCKKPYQKVPFSGVGNSIAIVVGSDTIELAKMIIDEWLSAEFEGGRHQTRVDMITAIENK